MADTQARVPVTTAAWVPVTVGPAAGTIMAESHAIRLAISTSTAPVDLTQGEVANPKKSFPFVLDTGETLFAIANGTNTTFIATF
jgi:hypothetical protein